MTIKSILFIGIAVFIPVLNVSAQVLEKIPGQASATDGDLVGYLNNLYKFGISITGILAIFMIGLGAFAYIVTSAGNSSKMLDAKDTIQNALIGLAIALTAYLLLYVINPDLISGTLSMPTTAIDAIVDPVDLSEIGCCLTTAGACTASVTKGSCNEAGYLFEGGTDLVCQAYGMAFTCVTGSAIPVDTVGCCTYDDANPVGFINNCNATTTLADCQALSSGVFTAGESLTCNISGVYGVMAYSCQ